MGCARAMTGWSEPDWGSSLRQREPTTADGGSIWLAHDGDAAVFFLFLLLLFNQPWHLLTLIFCLRRGGRPLQRVLVPSKERTCLHL